MVRGALITANLPQLQNLIKRDPLAYREEFLQQWNHYNSARQLFNLNPKDQAAHFKELLAFISQVAPCYPKETAVFPSQLFSFLTESYSSLPQEIQKSVLQSLVMLRNKDVISSINLLKHLFPLLPRTSSASLRLFIRHTILSDIASANARHKNHALNRAVQAMLFGMVECGMESHGDKFQRGGMNANDSEAMWAIVVAKELWQKRVWVDTKTVAIVALGCTHYSTKVQSAAIHFFVGEESADGNDKCETDKEIDVGALQHRRDVNKKTRSGDKKFRKQLKNARRKASTKESSAGANFPALELLRDPQTFVEKVFEMLNHHENRFPFDHKVLIMQLLSRIMSVYKIYVFNFYTYILKFLHHRQLRIASILVALAQSVHDMTPPDAIEPVIRKLAQEFVHPGLSNEVIAAGLNSIREICRRQPWAMNVDLLEDLIEYKKSRDRGIVAAARGLLQLYREIGPSMLKRRERGKEASTSRTRTLLPFGHSNEAAVDIEGLTLLEDHFNKLREESGVVLDAEEAWDGWSLDSSSIESDSDGWMNVEDGEGEILISDSDDEARSTGGEVEMPSSTRVSTLATTKILTPADFALMTELRIQEASKAVELGGGSAAKRKLASLEANQKQLNSGRSNRDTFMTEDDILGRRKRQKADYAERLASVQNGREGRAKFGSHRGKAKKAIPSSSTNREKVKQKPIMMILSSGAVHKKKKASLREKQQKLRAHVERMKRGPR